MNRILQGDYRQMLGKEYNGTVDLFLTDPPYNSTRNGWDKQPINLAVLRETVLRLAKPNWRLVMTTAEPFTSLVVAQFIKYFDYDVIWEKYNTTDFLNANRKPMRKHENILVFHGGKALYNPQMIPCEPYHKKVKYGTNKTGKNYGKVREVVIDEIVSTKYPSTIQRFNFEKGEKKFHPTQKPRSLWEWAIKSYSNNGDTVADFFGGSLLTASVCLDLERGFIVCEQQREYVDGAISRNQKLGIDNGVEIVYTGGDVEKGRNVQLSFPELLSVTGTA